MKKKEMAYYKSCFIILFFTSLLAVGCATTMPGHTVLQPISSNVLLSDYLGLYVEVSSKKDIPISEFTLNDAERIKQLIIAGIKAQNPNRFKNINDTTNLDSSTLNVSINVTRYDKGNAFARFMLAGLGQIHIDAEVNLIDAKTQKVLGSFEVNKTFAWGGIYGGSTTIIDVEKGVVEEIVSIILKKA